MICFLDPVLDRAAIDAVKRSGGRGALMVRSNACIRMIMTPEDRPLLEAAVVDLLMRQLVGPGWGDLEPGQTR